MVEGFGRLLFADLFGECARALFGLPIPGPVIGMFILAIAILVRSRIGAATASSGESPTERAADALIRHMGLLFVPAGVGIVAIAPTLHGAWTALGVALLVSTLITLAVTGGVMHILGPRREAALTGRAIVMEAEGHE